MVVICPIRTGSDGDLSELDCGRYLEQWKLADSSGSQATLEGQHSFTFAAGTFL